MKKFETMLLCKCLFVNLHVCGLCFHAFTGKKNDNQAICLIILCACTFVMIKICKIMEESRETPEVAITVVEKAARK